MACLPPTFCFTLLGTLGCCSGFSCSILTAFGATRGNPFDADDAAIDFGLLVLTTDDTFLIGVSFLTADGGTWEDFCADGAVDAFALLVLATNATLDDGAGVGGFFESTGICFFFPVVAASFFPGDGDGDPPAVIHTEPTPKLFNNQILDLLERPVAVG